MTIHKARIAIIGTGWWATEAHIPGVLDHADAELVAICDRDPERLRKAAQTFDVTKTYTDYRTLLAQEDLDGAIIVTPHATHHAIAKECLEHNVHLLIEKPMTLYARDARDLVELAAAREREIVMGYTYNFIPHAIRAREAVQSGSLGAIQYVSCTFASDVRGFLSGDVSSDNAPARYTVQGPGEDYNRPDMTGGGEGHLQITHVAGLMFFVSGLRAQQVHALMRNHGLAVDLVDAMLVDFVGEAIGMVGGTGNAGRNHKMGVTLYCENGCVDVDSSMQKLFIRRHDGSDLFSGEMERPHTRYTTTHNLIDVILKRAENGSPGELGWRVVELLDAAYRSAAHNGQGVTVASLYQEHT